MFSDIPMHPSWADALAPVLARENMAMLSTFLDARAAQGAVIYPPRQTLFRALELTPLSAVRVVILGQDPYHGAGQAHGLSFSVLPGVPIPPSLRNIYQELGDDVGIAKPQHGCLERWSKQGVLMLNTVLSVEEGQPGAHQGRGWEMLTDAVISHCAALETPVVFMLWGAQAQKKLALVNRCHHLLLTAPHPSPLSAHRGFLGCRHFSKANAFLEACHVDAIDWAP
jgi:uracil-DNA glycosylase